MSTTQDLLNKPFLCTYMAVWQYYKSIMNNKDVKRGSTSRKNLAFVYKFLLEERSQPFYSRREYSSVPKRVIAWDPN